MNTHKTLRIGALGTLVAVAVLTGCNRSEPDTSSSTVTTPPASSSSAPPAGSSSSSTTSPGTSGYVGPSDSTTTSPSSSGSAGGPGQSDSTSSPDTSSSSSSSSTSPSPGPSGYVGGSSGSTSGSDTEQMQNRSGSSSSGSGSDTSGTSGSSSGSGSGSGSGSSSSSGSGTSGNPVGPNSRLDRADRPFRDVAVRDRPDAAAVWREALGVRIIRVADAERMGDARKSGSGSAGMGLTQANPDKKSSMSGDKLSKKDSRFLEKAAAGGMFEVEAARLASEKASDPQVKSFAAKLMEHHQQANAELKQIADARGVTLPTKLPSKEQAMIDKLSKAEGDKFDKEFLKTVGLRDHKEDIRQFENAQKETTDSELKAWIAKTLPTLRTHLAEAQSMSGGSPKMQGYTGSSTSQPSKAAPRGSGMDSGSGASSPGSMGPTGTGVGGSPSPGGSAGGAAGGN